MSPGLATDSNMEKMKKLLNSPGTRRKQQATADTNAATGSGQRYFGVTLEDLVRGESRDIPCLVTKICSYIHQQGLDNEGLFRVNGNAKVVERLKSSFNRTGDADLEEVDDIMAVAGLLKLFLRELPEALVPEYMTRQFVSIHEDPSQSREQWKERMCHQLKRLGRPHLLTLKFLIRFLVLVSQREADNKMGPVALGIVFGPNLFRCAPGIAGLKEQGVTNHIVTKFITDYDTLFLEEHEISPHSPSFNWERELKKGKVVPPRPPPPTRVELNSNPPIPSPRKTKMRLEERLVLDNHPPSDRETPSELSTPRSRSELEDEFLDSHRSSSPFGLESDRSECAASGIMSPMMTTFNALAVESAITSAISEHLFGGGTPVMDSDGSPTKQDTPVPPPRRKRSDRSEPVDDSPGSSTPEDRSMSDDDTLKRTVRQRAMQFEVEDGDTQQDKDTAGRPRKQKPINKAFEMFESQGIIIGPAPDSLAKKRVHDENDADSDEDWGVTGFSSQGHRPQPQPRAMNNKWVTQNGGGVDSDDEDAEMELGAVQRGTSTLNTFKRPAGPRNRQKPTRQTLRQTTSSEDISMEDRPPPATEFLAERNSRDVNHNARKPSTKFLNLHSGPSPAMTENMSSEVASPEATRRIFVPPLDLSILHEHGDGNDPIPAVDGPSIALQKALSFKEDDGAVISPRMSKLKKKSRNAHDGPLSPSAFRIIALTSVHQDTDVPPSPPTEQSPFSKRIDDSNTAQIKLLTKKIQSCKRKIKVFEEDFEQEHGYRPSQTDKASRADIKKCMLELARARKDLKTVNQEIARQQQRFNSAVVFTFDTPGDDGVASDGVACAASPPLHELKEELENERFGEPLPTDNISVMSGKDSFTSTGSLHPHISVTLETLLVRLGEKRREGGRPEDLALMTRDQVQEEKLSVQKALLHFESIHGRPATRTEKDLMKPLYDRYRNVKRLLTKPLSPRDKSNELQSVPEDLPIEFASPTSSTKSSNRDGIFVPTADTEDDHDEFLVTKDMRLLRDTVRPPEGVDNYTAMFGRGRNLHELSISELEDEQYKARNDKKRLRRVLKEFEDDFMREHGRKVLKEDRDPLDAEYNEYKQVKARLKLLEALLSKHDPMTAY